MRKQLTLFMPLATIEEVDDAQLAFGWIKMLDERHQAARQSMSRETAQMRAKIIDRYGLLFPAVGGGGRELVCRKCLGVRYGEVKWDRDGKRRDKSRRTESAG